MSDAAISKDCLHHYDNRHIQVRWDFFELCAYDKSQFNCRLNGNGKIIKDEPNQECMAKILRILETLTDTEKLKWLLDAQKLKDQGLKPPHEPKEYPIQLSYSAIVSLLYGTYGESTVRNSVAVLIQRNFIKQYQQTKNSIPYYVLRTDIVQKALKDQAEKALSGVEINSQSGESFQVLKSTARRPKSTAKPLISKGGSSEINSQTSEINNNNNRENNNKQREGKNATPTVTADKPSTPSSTPSSLSSVSSEKLDTPEQERIAGYLEELDFPFDITPENKSHLEKIAKHVKSLEKMRSLLAHTKNQEHLKGKAIYLGNLANTNNLNGWKQKQQDLAQPPAPKEEKSALGVSGLPLCMSNPNEPRLPYKFTPGKSRRRVVAQ